MRRTATALGLTLAAVALPSVAWYVSGSRAAEREARETAREPLVRLREELSRRADRLGVRLETLRESESRRPFFHYQSLYHDPKGAHEGHSVTPSPLAGGPVDPLVHAHFMIDARGHLTLPTLNEEVCDLNAPESEATQEPILRELQTAARVWWRGMRDREPPAGAGAYDATLALAVASGSGRTEMLDGVAWVQNLEASELYLDLKRGKAPQAHAASLEPVPIHYGDFVWQTVPIGGIPSLVALREVVTPAGALTQGFRVRLQSVAELLADLPFAATFEPGIGAGELAVNVAIPGAAWHVAWGGEVTPLLDEAARHAARLRGRFLRTFAAGTALALLSALLLVGLVWQSERLARERSRFAATAAHELRTPLAGLRMYAEMLAEDLGDPAKSRDYARRIAEEADRLGRVVGNVLGFTRLERGSLGVQSRPGDLASALSGWLERLAPTVETSGMRLVPSIDQDLPRVRFDPDATLQILQNLLDNAGKHAADAADRSVDVRLGKTELGVELQVRDRGRGVPPDLKGRMFRPFARAADNGDGGLGLGLVMVDALARAQGARVSYRDASPGASFCVTFPASA